MERGQCKAKGRSVGCCGYAGEEMATKEMWQIETWTERPGAGLMILAARMLTNHPLKGKDQKGQRAGKGREHKGNGNLFFFNDYPCIVSQCEQHCQRGNITLFLGLSIQYGTLRLLQPGQEKLS